MEENKKLLSNNNGKSLAPSVIGGSLMTSFDGNWGMATSPFSRSLTMQRTPPDTPRRISETSDKETHSSTSRDNGEEAATYPLQINEGVSKPSISLEDLQWAAIKNMREKEETEMSRFKAILNKMNAATLKQRNISIDVKNGLAELAELISAMTFYRHKWKEAEQQMKEQSDQTNQRICTFERGGRPLTQSSTASVQGTPQPGSSKDVQPLIQLSTDSVQGTPQPGSSKRPASSPAINVGKKTRGEITDGGWEVQQSKGQRRRRKQVERLQNANTEPPPSTDAPKNPRRRRGRNVRPEALLIRPAEGQSYAEVLREIRSGAKPDDSEVEVTAIRQTKAGDVLLELGPQTKNKEAFCEVLNNLLGERGKVSSLGAKVQVEIRDLDSFTDENEVEVAIRGDFPEVGDLKVNIFPTIRGQKVAIVTLSRRSASKLIKQEKIRIGWVRCRVRRRAVAERCFKCLGYGHVARSCTGEDRSSFCYKCFGDGHKAKECTAQMHCVLCSEKGVEQEKRTHVPGSGKYQLYREALQAVKNRL